MTNLGVHVPVNNFDAISKFLDMGIRTFQFHLQNPIKWSYPDVSKFNSFQEFLLKQGAGKCNLVFHGPYTFSIPNQKHFSYALQFYTKFLKELDTEHKFYIVQHPGFASVSISPKTALMMLVEFQEKLYTLSNRYDVQFLFENTASANKAKVSGKYPVGRVNYLQVMSQVYHHKICFDTEHAFAAGVDISNPKIKDFLSRCVGLVHLNSIPPFVGKGSHLDRHSDTLIQEGIEQESLINIYKYCNSANIPMILERRVDIVEQDIKFLRSL